MVSETVKGDFFEYVRGELNGTPWGEGERGLRKYDVKLDGGFQIVLQDHRDYDGLGSVRLRVYGDRGLCHDEIRCRSAGEGGEDIVQNTPAANVPGMIIDDERRRKVYRGLEQRSSED